MGRRRRAAVCAPTPRPMSDAPSIVMRVMSTTDSAGVVTRRSFPHFVHSTRRLMVYGAEAFFEILILAIAMYTAVTYLSGGFFIYYLALPAVLVLVRVLLLLRFLAILDDVAEAVESARTHGLEEDTPTGWLCMAALLAICSAVQMVWYGFWFLLMLTYDGTNAESPHVLFLSIVAVIGLLANGALWRDCAKFVRGVPEMLGSIDHVVVVRKVERRQREPDCPCRMATLKTLRAESEAQGAKPSQSVYDVRRPARRVPDSCVICLEEFKVRDTLAQLPCGHSFHPKCLRKWWKEGRRCPFHCMDVADLEEGTQRRAVTRSPTNVPIMVLDA